jgi:hypothetical protein
MAKHKNTVNFAKGGVSPLRRQHFLRYFDPRQSNQNAPEDTSGLRTRHILHSQGDATGGAMLVLHQAKTYLKISVFISAMVQAFALIVGRLYAFILP